MFNVRKSWCKKLYLYHAKIVNDFLYRCSAEWKDYKAPLGYESTFRKLQKSNADRKRGISIDKRVYTPKVGVEITDVLNFYNFDIYKKPFGGIQPIDKQSEEEFSKNLDLMNDYIVLAKKEFEYPNEVTSWNNWKKGYTKFQYMLWITTEKNKKIICEYNKKWGFLKSFNKPKTVDMPTKLKKLQKKFKKDL
tara:strand:- start:1470 stop:2045 length:576 start_codon:yes stop_codon:yes gene_type:complete